MYEWSVLIYRAPDVEGQWVAHCLNWDLVSQGDSPGHAAQMIAEAAVLAIEEDKAEGFDSAKRPSAPKELWDLFSQTQRRGKQIPPTAVDNEAAGRNAVIAAVMYAMPVIEGVPSGASNSREAFTPPPFMIAEFQNHNETIRK